MNGNGDLKNATPTSGGDAELLTALGKTAGLGGSVLGVFLLAFRDFVRQTAFQAVDSAHAYNLILIFILLLFGLSMAGLAVWANRDKRGRWIALPLLLFAIAMTGVAVWATERPQGGSRNGSPFWHYAYSITIELRFVVVVKGQISA